MESLDYKNWMATSTVGLWPTGVVPGKQPNGSYRDIEDLGIAKLYVGIGHEAEYHERLQNGLELGHPKADRRICQLPALGLVNI